MKVLCIQSVKKGKLSSNNVYVAQKEDEICEGEIYTVIEAPLYGDKIYYRLGEKPETSIYDPSFFIQTSTKDEVEMVKERDTNYSCRKIIVK
jgi:hypothetical protein